MGRRLDSSISAASIAWRLATAIACAACSSHPNAAAGASGSDATSAGATSGGATSGGATSGAGSDAAATQSGAPTDAAAESAPIEVGADTSASSASFIGGSQALVHDDFESGSLTRWTLTDRDFNPLSSSTVVTVDGTKARSGSHSVKISPTNGSGGFFAMAPPGPAFYVRAWVYMSADPGMGHWEQIVGRGVARNAGSSPAEIRPGGQFDILYVNDNQTDGYFLTNPNFFTDHMGVPPPLARWVCEELYFGDDTVKWWITEDGATPAPTPFLDIEPATKWYQGTPTTPWSPTYGTIAFGYGTFSGGDVDVWYDDVAIDTRRIGCN